MKSILRARIVCSILLIVLAGGAFLGFALWRLGFFDCHQDCYQVYDVSYYYPPDDSRTLEVRKWKTQDNYLGWDFCLVAPDGEEQLLERTHALGGAIITNVYWIENGVDISTRAPSGGFTLTWR